MLNLVFSSSTASGTFRNASKSAPQTSEEEQIIEQEYLCGAVGVAGEPGGGESSSKKGKRSLDMEVDGVPGNRRLKKKIWR